MLVYEYDDELDTAFVTTIQDSRRADSATGSDYSAYEEAAQDPDFMEDMRSITEAFSGTVRDGLDDESIRIDLENRLLEHLGIDFEVEEP